MGHILLTLFLGQLTKILFYDIFFEYFYGGIAQSVEQTAHIRSVIGSSPIAAIIEKRSKTSRSEVFGRFFCF